MRSPVLLLAGLAACAHAPAAPPRASGSADYFPLAVGNQWVYRDESPEVANAVATLEALRSMLKRETENRLQVQETRAGTIRVRLGLIEREAAR